MKNARYFIFCLFLTALFSTVARIALVWKGSFAELWQDPDSLPLSLAAVQMSLLPQLAMAVAAGGILGLVSSVLQQLVRNNLASESTLAVSSGAQLALMIVTVFFPAAGLFGNFAVAFAGAVVAVSLVLFIAVPSKMNPLMLILGGLIINILFGAVAALIVLFYTDFVQGIMVWGSGSLVQDGWYSVKMLLIPTALFVLLLLVMQRPLTLMSLDEEQAQRLGLSVKRVRYAVLLGCAALTAWLVSEVGVIGFIGLAAASVVNVAGVRTVGRRFVGAFVMGALLLLLTDNLLAFVALGWQLTIPTGAFTAVIGSPLMIWLVLRQRKQQQPAAATQTNLQIQRRDNWKIPLFLTALLVLGFALAQGFVNSAQGWHWSWQWHFIEQFRYPRSLSAIATGAMLAAGGVLLQTLTRNPMASPEVLGISAGASLGVIGLFLIVPGAGVFAMLGAGSLGSLLVLSMVLWLARYLAPAYLLLTGVAFGALSGGMLTLLQVSGNPYLQAAMTWLSGSTYNANPMTAWLLFFLAVGLFFASLLLLKPLRLLSLGGNVAQHLGLSVSRAEKLILLLVALMSTGATLAVGPLSFIGLMTPHLARQLGAVTLEKQFITAVLIGMSLMLCADWLGRYLIFPYELAAGTLCALLGGSYFLWTLRKVNR